MRRAVCGSLVALLLAACPPRPEPGEPDDAGVAMDAGPPDLSRDPSCPADVAWLAQVRGSVVDESGAPLADAFAQMCVRTHSGRFLCLQPETTNGEGVFEVLVADAARCVDRATLRVLLPQADRATLYCGVPLSLTEVSITLSDPFVLVATAPPVERPPRGDEDVTRTVMFADGLAIDITPAALLFPEDYDRLAARALAPADVPACVLEGAPAFDGVIAFSPESELSDASFALRIPHDGALANGASVELYLQGGLSTSLADGTRVEEGVWQRFGTGTVMGDVIDVPASEGVPSFNWLGWRSAP